MSASARHYIPWPTISVGTICVMGMVTGLWLLYQDLRLTGQAGVGAPAGVIETREADVQRRAASSYLWNYAEVGERLYQGDAIRVGPEGSAIVQLDRGATLELGENSFVIIEKWHDLPLRILEGDFILHGGAEGDKKISIDKTGVARVEPLLISLLSPKPFERRFVKPGQPAEITLRAKISKASKAETPPQGLTLQLATDRYFSSKSTVVYPWRDVTSREVSQPLTLPPGRYFWRISQEKEVVAPPREFAVVALEPLRPIFPFGDTVTTIGERANVGFRWSSSSKLPNGVRHELEISRDAQFKTIAIRETIDGDRETAKISGLTPGKYYWRLSSRLSGIEALSTSQNFTIEKLAKPELIVESPEEGATFDLKKGASFQWSLTGAEVDFGFEIEPAGTDSAGQKINRAKATFLHFAPPRAGRFRWRVVATFEDKSKVTSEWRTLTFLSSAPLKIFEPRSSSEILFWKSVPVIFRWAAGDGGKSSRYKVGLYRDAAAREKVWEKETEALSLETSPLEPGIYYWRVTETSADGVAAQASSMSRFSYQLKPLLEAPSLLSPPPAASLDGIHKRAELKLAWAGVNDATQYEVIVFQKEKVWKQTVKGTSIKLPKLAPGKYEWTVRAVDPVGRVGKEAVSRSFQIFLGKRLPAPAAATAVDVP